MTRRLKILGYAQDDGVCTRIRIKNPLNAIKRRGLADVLMVDKSMLGYELETMLAEALDEADVIWFGRAISPTTADRIRDLQELGKKIVLDLDDNIFDVSPLSPHYEHAGVEEAWVGGVKVWEDGKAGFDIKRNLKRQDTWREVLGTVDAVSVTTPHLAKQYAPLAKRTLVIPNAVDFAHWREPSRRFASDGDVRIVWQGGNHHYEDIYEIKDVFGAISARFPQVKWVFVGSKWDALLKDVPADRVEFHTWVPYDAYPYLMRIVCPDIGIAPLRDTRFNKCISPLKWLDYASMAVPCVASNVHPYKDAITDGKDGLLASGVGEWVQKLTRLIEDPLLRAATGAKANATAHSAYDLDEVAVGAVELFGRLLEPPNDAAA